MLYQEPSALTGQFIAGVAFIYRYEFLRLEVEVRGAKCYGLPYFTQSASLPAQIKNPQSRQQRKLVHAGVKPFIHTLCMWIFIIFIVLFCLLHQEIF
jgi:hypothetical protein